MALYRISVLAILQEAGQPAAPGARLRLGPRATLLVEEVEDGPDRVAAESPFGPPGAAVTPGPALTLTGPDGPVKADLLDIAGAPAALAGAEAALAGETLEVLAVARPGGKGRLRSHAETAESKPGKTLFCLTPGTRIDTPDGPRLIEELRPGDRVTTLDNGSQPVRWIGRRIVSAAAMAVREDLRPVLVEAGELGNPRPLLVAPRHRLLLGDWRAQVYFGEDQVLIPVQALLNGTTIRQTSPDAAVEYLHLLFDRHEVIVTEGVLSESFHPGERGLQSLEPGERQEIEALFPGAGLERRRAAFPMVRMAEARALRLPG